jgi:mono/diheme cytochrome c family protein
VKKTIKIILSFIAFISCNNVIAQTNNIDAGQSLYTQWCSSCHGIGEVASIFLNKRYEGTTIPGALEKRTNITRDLVRLRVRTQITGMPAFRPTELSEKDIELVADYLTRNNPG